MMFDFNYFEPNFSREKIMSENLEKTVRSGKQYYPTPENKREIGRKTYWEGFKAWIYMAALGAVSWVAGLVIPPEYPAIYEFADAINSFYFALLTTVMGSSEPIFTFIQTTVLSFGDTGYDFEISVGICILLGVMIIYLLPYAFFPVYYLSSKKEVRLNYQCNFCNKDWVLEETGNKELYDLQKSYTNTQETELQILGDKKRDVDKQQEYTDKFYEYEWVCKHCYEITLKRGVESTLNKETVTSRSNWYKK